MTFADGWVCRSCWKPNRARDTRCYRCKTERDADATTVEARRVERTAELTRQDRVPGLVAALPATVFAWYGRLLIVAGVLFLAVTILAIANPDAPAGAVPLWFAFAVGTIAAGAGMRWASGAMRASSPWAFAFALVISLALVGGTLLAITSLPADVGNPIWMRYATIGVFGLAAILALVGLLFSLTGDRQPGPPKDG